MIGEIPYVIKGIAGFYYVQTQQGVIECRAKGVFRKEKITPTVGDFVQLEHHENTAVIAQILPRKNLLVRPAIANVDLFFLVVSTIEPKPSYLVLDRLIAIAQHKGAQPILVITKADLAPAHELCHLYETAGFFVIVIDYETEKGIAQLKKLLQGKCSVFCGNSGVGKSTLLSRLLPDLQLETGEISKKLGRGRHTTRQVTLYECEGGLIADTPGFASLEIQKASDLSKESLPFAFSDFLPFLGDCQYLDCSHLAEKGCAVRKALEDGKIHSSRYQSYVTLYQELEQKKYGKNSTFF